MHTQTRLKRGLPKKERILSFERMGADSFLIRNEIILWICAISLVVELYWEIATLSVDACFKLLDDW